jgi:hypothetical protein
MKLLLPRFGFGLALLLAPAAALADYGVLNNAVNMVGGMMPNLDNYTGGSLCDALDGPCGFAAIASTLLLRFRPLLTVIGIMGMSFAGIRMIIAQEDDAITKARTVLSACIAGIILAYLIEPFLAAFYGQSGSVQQGDMAGGVAILSDEVAGVINWVLVIAASLAVVMIILSALKALTSSTSEEGIANMKKTVISVVVGIILLGIRIALTGAFISGNAHSLISIAIGFISYVLAFFCLAAVCVLIYAGVQLVVSWGNAEAMTKAKSILIRSVFGTIVFLLSLALVRFVIEPGMS